MELSLSLSLALLAALFSLSAAELTCPSGKMGLCCMAVSGDTAGRCTSGSGWYALILSIVSQECLCLVWTVVVPTLRAARTWGQVVSVTLTYMLVVELKRSIKPTTPAMAAFHRSIRTLPRPPAPAPAPFEPARAKPLHQQHLLFPVMLPLPRAG
jgi:hypothetical protein